MEEVIEEPTVDLSVQVGATQMGEYLSILKGKNVALLVNQTSTIGETHLVDTLLQKGISIKKIFAPEHGFRGEADAGEKVKDGKDAKTGIPLISLYGKNKKPSVEHLKGIDIVVFDIQDVGARFYTYISSMSYVMEACAENNIDFMVLDRPNPNGHFVDGPVLKKEYQSFVGLHQVPVVHGMTVGEYAQMVNTEGWLKGGVKCNLIVVKCENYDHKTFYELPIKPSPNLPNNRSIYLYPSLCFFEGTIVSAGRGTDKQFQIYGHPDFKQGDFTFTPSPMPGAKYPKFDGEECNGYDLTKLDLEEFQEMGRLNLRYLMHFYKNFDNKKDFFLENKFFDTLAGSATLRWQIINGKSEEEIRKSWQEDLNDFKKIRVKYLLYDDFIKG
ncbi:MAG: exo-beta-N-acetylmuramidase NamZ domain-containing protein [Saprospiraceae bacterium]